MEVGKTIRRLRTEAGMSQEELAEKVYVSRQTISNWENDKFYPDVQSLSLIADLFGTSIDFLVKGDLPMFEARIAEEDVKTFKRNAALYTTLLVVSLVIIVVAFAQENWLAIIAGGVVYAVALYFAMITERDKKEHDIHTYREIRAFMNGTPLEEIKEQRTSGNLVESTVTKILVGGCVGIVVGLVVTWLVHLF